MSVTHQIQTYQDQSADSMSFTQFKKRKRKKVRMGKPGVSRKLQCCTMPIERCSPSSVSCYNQIHQMKIQLHLFAIKQL